MNAAIAAVVAVILVVTMAIDHLIGTESERNESQSAEPIACSVLAVATVPLLFAAVPFPLAGAGIALGLMGREGTRRGLSTAAVVVGALVLALGLGVYVAAAV